MQILYIDQRDDVCQRVATWLNHNSVLVAHDVATATRLARQHTFDMVLVHVDTGPVSLADAVAFIRLVRGAQTIVVGDLSPHARLRGTEETLPDTLAIVAQHTVAQLTPSTNCDCVDPGAILLDIINTVSDVRDELAKGCK